MHASRKKMSDTDSLQRVQQDSSRNAAVADMSDRLSASSSLERLGPINADSADAVELRGFTDMNTGLADDKIDDAAVSSDGSTAGDACVASGGNGYRSLDGWRTVCDEDSFPESFRTVPVAAADAQWVLSQAVRVHGAWYDGVGGVHGPWELGD